MLRCCSLVASMPPSPLMIATAPAAACNPKSTSASTGNGSGDKHCSPKSIVISSGMPAGVAILMCATTGFIPGSFRSAAASSVSVDEGEGAVVVTAVVVACSSSMGGPSCCNQWAGAAGPAASDRRATVDPHAR